VSRIKPLADRLAPDTVNSLKRAAEQRVEDANRLLAHGRPLAALYFFGYSVEMVLCAAYYRNAGFSPNVPIDRDARQRRMARARQLMLMESDPHPLVGWARFLEWQRSTVGDLTSEDTRLLKEAIDKAGLVYKHWRPELRYKTAQVTEDQIEEVRRSATWFIKHREPLSGRD
jgi:hypothetical protein